MDEECSVADQVRPYLAKAQAHPMVDVAVSSMALAVFSKVQHHAQAAVEASIQYSKVLRTARTAIPELVISDKNIDACLLAVFLMSRYEDATYRDESSSPQIHDLSSLASFRHHDGAMALLKIWHSRQSCGIQPASAVIQQTRQGCIRSVFLRNLSVPRWMMDGSLFGESGLALDFDRVVVQLANLRHRIFKLGKRIPVHEESPDKAKSQEAAIIYNELQDADEALGRWSEQVTQDWEYRAPTVEELKGTAPPEHFYSQQVYVYSTPASVALWIHFFAWKLLISATRLQALQYLGLDEAQARDVAHRRHLDIQVMHSMSLALASSVPFALQRLDYTHDGAFVSSTMPIKIRPSHEVDPSLAALIVWPLSIAASLEDGLDAGMRAWFASELSSTGKILGISVLRRPQATRWLQL